MFYYWLFMMIITIVMVNSSMMIKARCKEYSDYLYVDMCKTCADHYERLSVETNCKRNCFKTRIFDHFFILLDREDYIEMARQMRLIIKHLNKAFYITTTTTNSGNKSSETTTTTRSRYDEGYSADDKEEEELTANGKTTTTSVQNVSEDGKDLSNTIPACTKTTTTSFLQDGKDSYWHNETSYTRTTTTTRGFLEDDNELNDRSHEQAYFIIAVIMIIFTILTASIIIYSCF